MTVPLSPELERFVEEEVHSGHFASREAVIEAALRDMQQRRAGREAKRRPPTNWVDEVSGSTEHLPEFEQAVEYGREIRRSQLTPEEFRDLVPAMQEARE